MALEMRTECERCGAALAPDQAALICSFECTFCEACAEAMSHLCPNCGGELVPRPRRVRHIRRLVSEPPPELDAATVEAVRAALRSDPTVAEAYVARHESSVDEESWALGQTLFVVLHVLPESPDEQTWLPNEVLAGVLPPRTTIAVPSVHGVGAARRWGVRVYSSEADA